MYTSKLKTTTSSVNVWRSLCWWPGLSYCLSKPRAIAFTRGVLEKPKTGYLPLPSRDYAKYQHSVVVPTIYTRLISASVTALHHLHVLCSFWFTTRSTAMESGKLVSDR